MTMHSSIVGGSTAGRLIACPGSFQATVTLPPAVTVASEYAEEGTFAHAVMELVMIARKRRTSRSMPQTAAGLIGTHIHDRVVTDEHYRDLFAPALTSLEELENEHGGGFSVVAVEKRARFPGIISAFGTIDLVLMSRKYVLHVDWKFGAGVPVLASTENDLDGDIHINSQLMFYTAACRSSMRSIYRGRRMLAAIIQPRADVMSSWVEISDVDISEFKKQLSAAVDAALQPGAERARGEHCRFAPCKTTCPLWTGPLLTIAALRPVGATTPAPVATPYAEYLAHAKSLCDQLAIFSKEVNDQLHAYLEGGGTVPGWRLKAKVKQRQWIDPDEVAAKLRAIGFTDEEIWQTKLQTFAATDATAKRLGVTIPDELRVMPPSNETTVAPDDDPAPVVSRITLTDQLRASLRKLTHG